MDGQTIVAVYESRTVAERARDKLMAVVGIANVAVRLSQEPVEEDALARTRTDEKRGFWDWLLGTEVPESDRNWYRSSMQQGRTALSVRLSDGTEAPRIVSILDETDPVEIDAGTASIPSTQPAPTSATGGEKEHIPVIKEELEIGKRQTERRYRVRVYPVAHPVEEQVNLRDEKVVIERRPVGGGLHGARADELQPRELEIVERHEEPVVGKRARQTEEVVIRKDVEDRTETVRGNVRETEVDIVTPDQADKQRGAAKR
jgi:stress response protein YsnF